MVQVSARVDVAADAEATWEAATDWENQRRWVLGSRVLPGHNEGREVGGTVLALTGYGRAIIRDPMVITTWDPPRTVTLRHTGQMVTGTATYRVEALGPYRSRLTWSEDLAAPGPVMRALYTIGVPLFGLVIRLSLLRFARWVPNRR